ncbi:MAG: T9SS type A sorting domain-containing protein [Flavobacteriales bacterium]|nr:T9SS type A sorting domain-containing protein [Flavobacteriales bacterium]
MKKLILLFVVVYSLFSTSKAQQAGDTIVIESFNYTQTYGVNQWSPGIRDTIIDFSVLPNTPIEKVLMLYNMRCKNNLVSNSSNKDQGCGEWDASCNTYLYDSTRVDSVVYSHPNYIVSNYSGTTFDYTSQEVYNYYQYEQDLVSVNNVTNENSFQISTGSLTDSESLDGSQFSGKSQFLYTASELIAAGFSTGEIDGLELESSNAGALSFFKVKIKETSLAELDPKTPELSNFTEVYNSNCTFNSGANKIIFSSPFVWNGTDNLIIEFSFTNSEPTNSIQLSAENASNNGLIANNGYAVDLSNNASIEVPVDAISSISDEITISFWVFGYPELLPSNTWTVDAIKTDGVRAFNVHLPWSDSNVYFDCGSENSDFDRIYKSANVDELEGQWNHWAFTKNTNSGEMKIYLNGSLWHSGTGKTKPIDISSMKIKGYKGIMDEVRIWDKELSQTEISEWKSISLNNSHPNYSNLVAYYKMDEGSDTLLNDLSTNNLVANSSSPYFWKKTRGKSLSRFFKSSSKRPKLTLFRGDYTLNVNSTTVTDSVLIEPHLVQEYNINPNPGTLEDDEVNTVFENSYWGLESKTFNGETGQEISSTSVNSEGTITINQLEYYRRWPAKIEIMSFVTPYGLGLNLGPTGKTWTFDMTDFLPVFNGKKRMTMERGGQWMEDMDIKFLFILATPPRDVIGFNQLWRPVSRSYSSLESDRYFAPRDIKLNTNAKYYKIRSAITGHGQEGEFIPRQHYININGGATEFNWQVWKECAENPIYPQGGTWIYDRAGWCPGAPTDVKHYDITELVGNNSTVSIDYGVLNASGTSNYIINNQLITYGEINHDLDASVVEVREPSNRVEFSRYNSICHTPKVVIKNTGKTTLTTLVIKYWINNATSPQSYNWTGSLDFNETETVSLPSPLSLWLTVNPSNNVFHVEVSSPNGSADEYEHNNLYHSEFEIPDVLPEEIVIYFKTNNVGSESSYKIIDNEGNSVFSRSGLGNNTTYRDTIQLEYGCYTFRVDDSDDDGIDFWANNNGVGACRIFKPGSGLIKNFDGDFGDNINFNFTVGSPLKYEDFYETSRLSIYPNPANDIFFVEGEEVENAEINILDSQGREVNLSHSTSKNKLSYDSGKLPNGIYLIQIIGDKINETKRLIID